MARGKIGEYCSVDRELPIITEPDLILLSPAHFVPIQKGTNLLQVENKFTYRIPNKCEKKMIANTTAPGGWQQMSCLGYPGPGDQHLVRSSLLYPVASSLLYPVLSSLLYPVPSSLLYPVEFAAIPRRVRCYTPWCEDLPPSRSLAEKGPAPPPCHLPPPPVRWGCRTVNGFSTPPHPSPQHLPLSRG